MRQLLTLPLILTTSSCAAWEAVVGTSENIERTTGAVATTVEAVSSFTLNYLIPAGIAALVAVDQNRRRRRWKKQVNGQVVIPEEPDEPPTT